MIHSRLERLKYIALELIPAIIVAVVVLVAVSAYGLTRPPVYEARSTLVATPTQTQGETVSADFPSVVGLTLAGVDEFVHTDSVLGRIHAEVPSSSPPDELTGQIAVTLVPASGVVRISVRQGDPESAAAVVRALSDEVEQSDLLSPVGQFRTLDANPIAFKVAPDPRLALGLTVAAAAIAGLLTLLLGRRLATTPARMSPLMSSRGIPFIDARENFSVVSDVVEPVKRMRVVPVGRVNPARVEWVRESLGPDRLAEALNAPVGFLVSDGSTSRRDIQLALSVFERRRVPVVCAILV